MNASHRFSNDLRYRPADHEHQTALTPAYVLDLVRLDLGGQIGLDPCTTPTNPCRAEKYYALPTDGLTEPWDSDSIYVNPPYGRAREPWAQRCVEVAQSGARVVLLIPSHTDTRVFQRLAADADYLVFLGGRVKFGEFGQIRDNGRQAAASHGSVLFGWNTNLNHSTALGIRLGLRP